MRKLIVFLFPLALLATSAMAEDVPPASLMATAAPKPVAAPLAMSLYIKIQDGFSGFNGGTGPILVGMVADIPLPFGFRQVPDLIFSAVGSVDYGWFNYFQTEYYYQPSDAIYSQPFFATLGIGTRYNFAKWFGVSGDAQIGFYNAMTRRYDLSEISQTGLGIRMGADADFSFTLGGWNGSLGVRLETSYLSGLWQGMFVAALLGYHAPAALPSDSMTQPGQLKSSQATRTAADSYLSLQFGPTFLYTVVNMYPFNTYYQSYFREDVKLSAMYKLPFFPLLFFRADAAVKSNFTTDTYFYGDLGAGLGFRFLGGWELSIFGCDGFASSLAPNVTPTDSWVMDHLISNFGTGLYYSYSDAYSIGIEVLGTWFANRSMEIGTSLTFAYHFPSGAKKPAEKPQLLQKPSEQNAEPEQNATAIAQAPPQEPPKQPEVPAAAQPSAAQPEVPAVQPAPSAASTPNAPQPAASQIAATAPKAATPAQPAVAQQTPVPIQPAPSAASTPNASQPVSSQIAAVEPQAATPVQQPAAKAAVPPIAAPAAPVPAPAQPAPAAVQPQPKPEPQKPAEERGKGLAIRDIAIANIFPIFHTFYDDHPVGKLTLRNTEYSSITDITVSMIIRQYMDAAKECATINELKPGEERSVDLFALFKSTILDITQATKVAAEISVSYTLNGKPATTAKVETIRIYDRNAMTWDDNRKAAAFVTPKEPMVLVFSNNINAALKGKMNRAMDRNMQTAIALHDALRLYGISYVSNPLTPYAVTSQDKAIVDTLKFPRQTFEYKSGDCSDLSILYSALMESVQIETAFITIPGHIFMAFALRATPDEIRQSFSQTDELIFRNDKVWVPVEVTEREKTFLDAWQSGAREWRDSLSKNQAGFYMVHDAWAVYEPVGLPGSGNAPVLPDASQVVKDFQDDLARIVDREIFNKVAALQAAIAKNQSSPKTVNALGVLYARYDLTDRAEREFKKAIAKSEYVPALSNLGNLAYRNGDMDSALAYYNRAYKKDPKNPGALLGIARVSHEIENYATVKKAFTELKAVDPDLASRFAYLELKGEEATRAADLSEVRDLIIWQE